MKTLKNLGERQNIARRMAELSPKDKARWGSMSVHQMVCHLVDSYKVPLGEKTASPATSFIQRTVVKWAALKAPTHWPHGVGTRPEIEQGKGGTVPVDFRQDLARISHHDCLWDTFGCAVRLLLCICVLGLTGRSNFRPVRSCLGVSGVVFCMALPGPVTWAKVEV